ncbi:MAG: tRNA 2-thiouridine(34) synthase MnmA [Candidatus Paceibacterota bacterium]
MIKNTSPKTVIVGLSGGLDSAITAKLLSMANFHVIGVYLRLWQESKKIIQQRETQVKKIARQIGIPLLLLDAQKDFQKYVVQYFLDELKSGATPNPCVECNYYVKFRLLNNLAQALPADYIATGHYAKKVVVNQSLLPERKTKIFKIIKAKDKNKDQSYFLWHLNQKLLQKIIFPLGDFTKEEVKIMAQKWRLNFKNITESQDLCFINDLDCFIQKLVKPQPGPIINAISNQVLGEHQGLAFYTIGQRKYIHIPAAEPYYVVKKDLRKNILFIAPASQIKHFQQQIITLKKVNFIRQKPKLPFECEVKLRYRSKPLKAKLYFHKFYYLQLQKPIFGVTPGQSAVFYHRQELIGGGIIKK